MDYYEVDSLSDTEDLWTSYGNGLYKPDCDPSHIPSVGQIFPTLSSGISAYKQYAQQCGFITRLGTQKTHRNIVTLKYVLCSKAGDKCTSLIEYDDNPANRPKRRRVTSRTSCKAMISLKLTPNQQYTVAKFIDIHNHQFYTPASYQFLRPNRNLTVTHKKYLVNCQKSGVGPTTAHNVCSPIVGGPEYVGASLTDFRNFQRSLKIHIGEGDIQMVMDTFTRAKEADPDLYFAYDSDNCDRLTRLFWSDGISQQNYARYGDCLSFDTTYGTNRYSMVFCPITGVDNHESSVTFGAALISHEDIESFIWLFEHFLKCFKNRQPQCIITDQDHAMKNAISQMLPATRHRLCMWHITKKLHERVTSYLPPDNDFYTQFSRIIWSETLSTTDFESAWHSIISEYSLQGNPFLNSMYELRINWIPVYFKNTPMGMLLRTTSRSESENSAFGINTSKVITLVEFMWRFDTVIRNQRQNHLQTVTQYALDARPTTRAISELELDAWSIYTRNIFYKIRLAIIIGLTKCGLNKILNDDGITVYKVIDDNDKLHTVFMNNESKHCECTCNRLQGYGLICMHIFCTLNNARIRKIPRSMVHERWCRDPPSLPPSPTLGSTQHVDSKKVGLLNLEIWTTIHSFLSDQNLSFTNRENFLAYVKERAATTRTQQSAQPVEDATSMEVLTGIPQPPLITVQIPKMCKNKGCARCLQSEREKAINRKTSMKPRKCTYCQEVGTHNSRKCEVRIRDEQARSRIPDLNLPSSSA